jgi:hypothetical protein
MLHRSIIIVFICLCVVPAGAQHQITTDSTSVFFGVQSYYGKIFPHSSSVRTFSSYNPYGFQLEVSRTRFTNSSWRTCNCYSQNGVALHYINFNKPGILGSSVSAIIFAEPQLTFGKTELRFRAGIGLSYLTRVYHEERNPENIFFSNPVSGLMLVQLNARYWFHDRWTLLAGGAYQHISNGGSRQPNLGINFGTLSLGTQYVINPYRARPRSKQNLINNTFHYYAGFFGNSRSIPHHVGGRKMVIGFQAGFYKPFARMHAWGSAVEIVRDGSIKQQSAQGAEHLGHYVYAGLLRHHFLFGRFDLSQAVGFYLREYPSSHRVFQRYAMDYRVIQNLRIGFSLKAHLQVAEQMDIRALLIF